VYSITKVLKQLGKIDKWDVLTAGVYQQFGRIDSSGMAMFRHINSLGVSTVRAYQQLVIVCLQNVNKQRILTP
jgi:hypothetical protein